MPEAKVATELAVSLHEDRPGLLAKAAEAIASGGLNIDGFAEVDGVLHLLTSSPRSARHALAAAGLTVIREREVLVAHAENRPGAAARIFRRLADAGVNVAYTYLASGDRLVIAAEEPPRALAILRDERPAGD